MSKPATTCVFEVLRNGLLRYIVYTCPNLYDNVRVDCSVHTLQRSKPETTCVFEVLRNGLLRYILYTCPNLYDNVRVDCLGAYFTHVQTYMITFVLTASVHTLQRSKPETTCVFEVLRNGLLRYILYTCPNLYDNVRVDCLGAYFTHVQTYDNVRVHLATQWTA